MRVWLTKTVSVLLALCFPWVSAASGGMTLCLGPDGRVGLGTSSEQVCAGASSLTEQESAAAAACTLCLDEHGCADIPGKGLLHRPPPGVTQRRLPAAQALPYALAIACADSATPAAPVLPPAHVFDGEYGMRLRLAALSTVVLRL